MPGRMPCHVVIELNKGFGDEPRTVTIVPRDGEKLVRWEVCEQGNSMVRIDVDFAAIDGTPGRRCVCEYHNSFRLDRVYVDGVDE